MQGMQFDLDEIYSQSIMTKRPSILVEGVDDIAVYDRIVNANGKQAEVIAIETIEGFSKGCNSVIDAVNFLKDIPVSRYEPSDYILGIIDKDVRDFRGEVPENNLLLILDVYSIENHFVNSEVVVQLLKTCTKGTSELFTDSLKDKLLSECVSSMELLFLASLEALKGALDSNYFADFSYCQKYGRLKDIGLASRLRDKKNELYSFASTLSLSDDLDSLKKIAKGKWLLSIFCEELERVIKNLPEQCGVDPIKKCQMCVSEVENSCLYRISEGFSHKTMREIAKQQYDTNEISYIRERVATIARRIA
ncbi:DUF4435 domain-containing protein [Oceanobacter sp. 3_MG-2023]|uniref:DUF4435 domain-containing protein n=1 Tax=Oceanobacter sp. 3_MG-2023 TaxID=3062622 RepID=UPI00273416AF|nr:DUF4435 domain-containing protein [Oceanobacter sp. 3_MG-2023]MDP2507175.1 DUF4435 domain-containing protein [Oceanobacter sp. 3_MG-2023]